MDYSYSSGSSHDKLMLKLQNQVEFPENSFFTVANYSYSF